MSILRYLNLAVMGVTKQALGSLPVLVSRWLGRRSIQLVSVGVALLACWTLIVVSIFVGIQSHWTITALGIVKYFMQKQY